MAVAFGAAGTPVGQTGTGSSGFMTLGVPSGTVSGTLLLAFLLYDCNSNPTPPPGWGLVQRARAGSAGGSFQPPTLDVWRKVSNGTEGSSQTWLFSTVAWPTGRPDVCGQMLSYTGTDPATPVEVSAQVVGGGQSGGDLFRFFPTVHTATPNGWLITAWGLSGDLSTTSIAPSDTARSTAPAYHDLTLSIWDSNAALAAGTQTQREASTNSFGSWDGDAGVTLAVKILPSAGAGVAQAQTAQVVATAYGVTEQSVVSNWDVCSTSFGLPTYTWAIDWGLDGLAAAGKILNPDPYFAKGLTDWAGGNASVAVTTDLLAGRNLTTVLVTPVGGNAAADLHSLAPGVFGSVVPGQQYIADCWVWSVNGWTDMQATIDWYDAGGSYLFSAVGVATVAAAGVWTHLQQQFTAPSAAVSAVVRARAGSTPPATARYYVYGLLIMDPSRSEERITPPPTALVQMDILDGGATWSYGRDQMRQTSPAALGTASFNLQNATRRYSPDRPDSPLYGDLDAGRPMAGQVVWGDTAYPLFQGRVDNYNLASSRSNRSASFSFLDPEAGFQNTPVTTAILFGQRTGDAVNTILDSVGWTGPRSIDPGATVMPYWWLDNTVAGGAINDLVLSEGPPAIFYIAPDGTATFRDRTHRLLRDQSLTVQGDYSANEVDCATPPVTGLTWTDESFSYVHGWKDIVNTVNFSVDQRVADPLPSVVWSSTDTVQIAPNQVYTFEVVASDPFVDAVLPVRDTDFTSTGSVVLVFMDKTSGLSTTISLLSLTGTAVVTGMQLRAHPFSVVGTVNIGATDSTSIDEHGSQVYPNQAPWASTADAGAIASAVVTRYAQRRPTVSINVSAKDPLHYGQILQRTVSDRVHIAYGETGTDADFYVEHLAHTMQREDWNGRPPVHGVVLGCEQAGSTVSPNPFTFDLRGAGFDTGTFDAQSGDDPATVFVFDDPVQGAFGIGRLGT